MEAHATIISSISRTTLTQTFVNPYASDRLDEIRYIFPLYDGVSVVGFTCTIDERVIKGVVKERQKARQVYKEAVARAETTGLLEQLPAASDYFTTSVGNVPGGATIEVKITYLGELKHDAQVGGVRITIPTNIAPRYGSYQTWNAELMRPNRTVTDNGIKITVDAEVAGFSQITSIQSPSHQIAVSLGRTSVAPTAELSFQRASATLALGAAELKDDFVLQVVATNTGNPLAIFEQHPTIPNQRALMTTLVPKFNLPHEKPEIVFVCDRSGKMYGPMEDSFKRRYSDMNLEVFLLTDGKVWDQNRLIQMVNENVASSNGAVRVFTLGIGNSVSHALTEGIARAGNGFSQSVSDNEEMGSKIVRMIKGATFPHVTDYTLEVKYNGDGTVNGDDDDDFELVERVSDCLTIPEISASEAEAETPKAPISLFDTSLGDDVEMKDAGLAGNNPYEALPPVETPKLLQVPFSIPPLFPFSRFTVYLLMSSETCQGTPKSVVLRGTSAYGPLELKIPVSVKAKDETIHQLAAKKAVQELEESRGWIFHAKTSNNILLKDKYEGRFSDMVEREAVRLGVKYQVFGGKWCSFVAVENDQDDYAKHMEDDDRQPREKQPPKLQLASKVRSFGVNVVPTPLYKRSTSKKSGSLFGIVSSHTAAVGYPQSSATAFGVSNSNFSRSAAPGSSGGLFASAVISQQPNSGFSRSVAPGGSGGIFGSAAQLQQPNSGFSRSVAPGGSGGIFGSAVRVVTAQNRMNSLQSSKASGAGASTAHVDDEQGFLIDDIKSTDDPMNLCVPQLLPVPGPTEQDKLHTLITLQDFEGYWTWNELLTNSLGWHRDHAVRVWEQETVLQQAVSQSGLSRNLYIVSTAMVVAWLRKCMASKQDTWELVAAKGIAWLDASLAQTGISGEAMVKAASLHV